MDANVLVMGNPRARSGLAEAIAPDRPIHLFVAGYMVVCGLTAWWLNVPHKFEPLVYLANTLPPEDFSSR